MKLKLKKFTTGINVDFFKAEVEFGEISRKPVSREFEDVVIQEGDLPKTIDVREKTIKANTVLKEVTEEDPTIPNSDKESPDLSREKLLRKWRTEREMSMSDIVKKINECPIGGTRNGKPWEDICFEVIQHVFVNDFRKVDVKPQAATKFFRYKKNIRDLVLDNNAKSNKINCIWNTLKTKGVERIVFECKNCKNPSDEVHISQIHRYLDKDTRSLGIILARCTADNSAKEAINRYKKDGYMILIFNQEDLLGLIKYYINHGKVEYFFRDKLAEFDTNYS